MRLNSPTRTGETAVWFAKLLQAAAMNMTADSLLRDEINKIVHPYKISFVKRPAGMVGKANEYTGSIASIEIPEAEVSLFLLKWS